MSNELDPLLINYPALTNFLGAYFHQDFNLDHETIEGVISYYVKVNYKEQIKQTIIEIDKTLKDPSITNLDDALFNNFGCYYDYKVDNLTVEDWLKKVKKQLQQEIHLVQSRTPNDMTQKLKR